MTGHERLPVRRIVGRPDPEFAPHRWPATLAPVRQLVAEGVELGPLTILVGENGSGKSTLIEGIALAFGMSAEGGSTGARHSTRVTESDLWKSLLLIRDPGASRQGFFLRAETMHSFYTYLEENPGRDTEPSFHEMSHGESFLELLDQRFDGPGLYLLDEPESALSFSGSLALVRLLAEVARSDNAQAIVATHSPIIAAVPGSRLYEVGDWGLRSCEWADLAVVQDWQAFLQAPERYLRHVL